MSTDALSSNAGSTGAMRVGAVRFDAVILAGGKGSRLGGLSKPIALGREGETLLDMVIRAASEAERIVVVGDVPARDGILLARESPPFSGPASALACGLGILSANPAPFTLVLAADQPDVGPAVAALVQALMTTDGRQEDGAIAIDATNRDQYLIGIYSTAALRKRLLALNAASPSRAPTTADLSMRSLISGLVLARVTVPLGSADDVDTWDDAARLGVGLVTTRAGTPS